ncbi:MAG: hypothetical protein PHZ19_02810 [Candidatus Thermoplasmatota archaeon]|nr:hypothetical protein [Candidatus Thermoplasmatota archaeon]
MNVLDIGKLISGLKLLWDKIKKDKLYLVQLVGAILLVLLNYTLGPFLSDEIILGIGAALVVPDILWKAIVGLAKKLAGSSKEKKE